MVIILLLPPFTRIEGHANASFSIEQVKYISKILECLSPAAISCWDRRYRFTSILFFLVHLYGHKLRQNLVSFNFKNDQHAYMVDIYSSPITHEKKGKGGINWKFEMEELAILVLKISYFFF